MSNPNTSIISYAPAREGATELRVATTQLGAREDELLGIKRMAETARLVGVAVQTRVTREG